MRKIIHIDMDNTLCDFSGAHADALIEEPGILYPQSQLDFFRKLKPLPHAIMYTNALRRSFDVHIVTRPSVDNLLCFTEKALWIRDHFDREMLINTTMTSYKHKFIGDYLIDDTPWDGFLGEQILFGVKPFEDWRSVFNYIMHKEGLLN